MQSLAFTLYDLIAYLVPGAVAVWALAGLIGRMGWNVQQSSVTLPETAFAAAVAAAIYATGHALHAIANLTIDLLPFGGYPPGNYFPEQFEKDFREPFRSTLYNRIVNQFLMQSLRQPEESPPAAGDRELVNSTVKNAYWACYTVVAQSKPNSLVQIFSSMTGLCRGLCVGSFVITLAYLAGFFILHTVAFLTVAIVALGAGCLFLNRAARFKGYLTKTVYSDFLHISQGQLSDQG